MPRPNIERELTKDDVSRLKQIGRELLNSNRSKMKELGFIPDQIDRDARYLEIVADVVEFNIK